jgi:DNA recombination protein RmuC
MVVIGFIVCLILGTILGAAGVLLALRPVLRERAASLARSSALERELARAEAELDVGRRTFDERLEAAIKALSSEALDANSARFLELAETHLSGHVRPLKESLERMDQQLLSVERTRQEAYGSLRTEVTKLSERAGSLTNALRTPHVRGRGSPTTRARSVSM